MYATGVRLLADTSLAEDLVQEAFTNVWRGAGTFDSERGSFATWLYRITRNRAIDLDRKRRVRPSVTGMELPDNVPGSLGPEASVNGWDVSQALSPASLSGTERS